MRSFIFAIICLLLFGNLAVAQTNRGFKLLEKKKPEKAREAFVQDTTNAETAIAAYYGLARICQQYVRKSLDSLAMGLHFISKAEELYATASEQAKAFTKENNISSRSFNRYRERVMLSAWNALERRGTSKQWDAFKNDYPDYYEDKKGSLAEEGWNKVVQSKSFNELEKFRMEFPDFLQDQADDKVNAIRREIVLKTYKEAEDYALLTQLVHHHRDFLYDTNISMNSDLDTRLWGAFRREHSVTEFGSFLEDHPDHWIGYDCRAEICSETILTGDLVNLIDFLENYPESYLGFYIVSWYVYNNFRRDREAISTLSDAQKQRFDEVLATCKLDDYLARNSEVPEDPDYLRSLIERGAPSMRSFFLFKTALNNYLVRKMWDEALDLVNWCQPLFPNTEPAKCQFFYYTNEAWFAEVQKVLKTPYEPLNPRPVTELNTTEDEFLPIISPDNTKLYFTGKGRPDGLSKEDPYVVPLSDSTFGRPMLVNGLAGNRNESILSITAGGQQALVFVDGVLHLSRASDQGWLPPEKLPHIHKMFPWVGKATFSADGSAIIFEAMPSAPKAENSADMNIYVALQDENGTWEKPFPLPVNINTRRRERSPYLHVDGETLYFSSDGHMGLGGMDIFKTRRLDDTWTRWEEPVNMGKEMNTTHDDWGFYFSISPNGEKAFFSQKDPTGKRREELMVAGLPKRVRPKAVKIVPIPVSDLAGSTVVMKNRNGEVLKTIKIKPNQQVAYFPAPEEEELVSVETEDKDDNIPISIDIDLRIPLSEQKLDTLTNQSISELKAAGKVFQLADVRFDRGESLLKAAGKVTLDKFLTKLKSRKLKISITGHTDDVGIEAANQKLSEDRAQKVKNYLIERGYPEELIQVEGKGWYEPKVENTSEVNRAINRRVEFRFLKDH